MTIDLNGTYSILHNYSDIDVTSFNRHNFERGRDGIILAANTKTQFEATDIEIDQQGNILHTWDFGQIIGKAMEAGGDNPAGFVYPPPANWFHNNSATYNAADNTLIASSRENFVIAVDYDTQEIKWILGDPEKHWY